MLRIDLGVGNIIRYDRLPENYKKDSYPLPKEFEVKMERQVPLLAAGKLVLIGEEAMNRAVEGQYRYYRLYGLLEEMLERTGLVFSDIMKDYEIPDAEPYIRRLEKLYHFESAEAGVGGLRQCELRAVPETEGRHGKPSGADD